MEVGLRMRDTLPRWGHFPLDDAQKAPGCPAAPEEAATHPHHPPLRHPRRHRGGPRFRQARPRPL